MSKSLAPLPARSSLDDKPSIADAKAAVMKAHGDYSDKIAKAADTAPTHEAFTAERAKAGVTLDKANAAFHGAIKANAQG
jgi:hypothetical protein